MPKRNRQETQALEALVNEMGAMIRHATAVLKQIEVQAAQGPGSPVVSAPRPPCKYPDCRHPARYSVSQFPPRPTVLVCADHLVEALDQPENYVHPLT